MNKIYDASVNICNSSLLPVICMCWVGRAALQHEGELCYSLETCRNSGGLVRAQVMMEKNG